MTNMFSKLRYENYATARYLAFTCGSFQRMAHYLFGMTLELSYKQILNILKANGTNFTSAEERMIGNSHSLSNLHNLCFEKGQLQKIVDHKLFLKYADILYKTRYPIHVKESQESLSDIFPRGVSFSIYNVYPFDDLLSQIDEDIFNLTSNPHDSIIFLALYHTNIQYSNAVFHCNGIFYEQIDRYSSFLNPRNPMNQNTIKLISDKRETLLKSRDVYLGGDIKYRKDEPLKAFIKQYGS